MKKFLFFSAATLMITVSVNAQTPATLQSEIKIDNKVEHNIKKEKKEDRKELRKLKGAEVSYQSKQAFLTDFGNVPGTEWSRLDNFDEATFTKDGQTKSAFYDFDSKLVGTTQNKTYADIPAKAQQNIMKYYKGYTPVDVLLFDDNELNETDMILYGNQFADKDSYFVELTNGPKKIVVQVSMDGEVGYFTRLR